MPQELNWEGNARGEIVEYGISEMETGAVAVNIAVKIHDYWDTEAKAWVDCREADYLVRGDIWVVKKDKSLNQSQVEALCQHAGWDGDITALVQGTWKPTPCSVVITKDTYREEVRYRVAWLNAYDRTPGALGTMTPEKAAVLNATYGSQFRALAGNARRQQQQPAAGKPAAPPLAKKNAGKKAEPAKPLTEMTPAETQAEAATGGDGSDIPFGFWWLVPFVGSFLIG